MPVAIVTVYESPGVRNKDGRMFGGRRVAADQHLYPAGTLARLTWHHKIVICDVSDTGGAVRGQHFDVPAALMSHWIGVSHRRALTTTLHGVRVYVIRRGRPRPKKGRRH